jgi:hypothetical protein
VVLRGLRVRPVVLTVTTWEGPLPLPGYYLATPRGRTAYLVLGVAVPAGHRKYAAKITCERRPRSELEGAVVCTWWWNKRTRRK